MNEDELRILKPILIALLKRHQATDVTDLALVEAIAGCRNPVKVTRLAIEMREAGILTKADLETT